MALPTKKKLAAHYCIMCISGNLEEDLCYVAEKQGTPFKLFKLSVIHVQTFPLTQSCMNRFFLFSAIVTKRYDIQLEYLNLGRSRTLQMLLQKLY